jgi:hypothetical protein
MWRPFFAGLDNINDFCGKLRRARVVGVSLEKMENGKWGPVNSITNMETPLSRVDFKLDSKRFVTLFMTTKNEFSCITIDCLILLIFSLCKSLQVGLIER